MTKKIAIGALLFEGNTFSKAKAELLQFESNYLFEGPELLEQLRGGDVEVSGALQVFETAGAELIPLIATHGGCGGVVTKDCFLELKERLLARLRGHQVDGVFLALHGAMICEGIDDAEAELLEAVRAQVGDAPIVITLDLHAHVGPRMLDVCDAIVGYQHYPHDDTYETGLRAAGLLVRALEGELTLTLQATKLAMLMSPTMAGTREATPMRELYKLCRAAEQQPGMLSVSYFPSTPWAEREDGGVALVAVSDGPLGRAQAQLELLAESLWALRIQTLPDMENPDSFFAEPSQEIGPVILSEMSDAVGAGAGGDSSLVLSKWLKTGRQDRFLAQLVDPDVVTMAREIGSGGEISCQLGNKLEDRHGVPLAFVGKVQKVSDEGRFTYIGGIMSGIEATYGAYAILTSGKTTVLVTERPAYEYADEQYAAAGLDVRNFDYVLLKNPMNWRQAFRWAPRLVPLDTPGAGRADLRKLSWEICKRPFYPLDDSQAPLWRWQAY